MVFELSPDGRLTPEGLGDEAVGRLGPRPSLPTHSGAIVELLGNTKTIPEWPDSKIDDSCFMSFHFSVGFCSSPPPPELNF